MNHPADSAQPSDAFRDEDGVTWMLTTYGLVEGWLTAQPVDGRRWHSTARARKHTLTRLVLEGYTPDHVQRAVADPATPSCKRCARIAAKAPVQP